MTLKPPIGVDDFEKVIEKGYLYVDKTAMIAEVIETPAEVQLITRPRRFGKTINLSMLRYFFDQRNRDNAKLFDGLAIRRSPHFELQGSYPTIFLTLKDLKADSYEEFLAKTMDMMGALYGRHAYLEEGLTGLELKQFKEIAAAEAGTPRLSNSLNLLIQFLARHYNRKVILLIDEYDSPIHEAYAAGYYQEVVGFMRSYLGSALKGNTSLEKAVITGILRIARESIFSDLNNLKVFSIMDDVFSDKFGFTTDEVENLLDQEGWRAHLPDVERWYNGYFIGQTVIYNPWSILNYLDDQKHEFKAHWVSTSSNHLIREQILNASPDVHDQLKLLITGEMVETLIHQHTVFRDMNADPDTLWSFLLFSGYLKIAERIQKGNDYYYHLAIPNLEVEQLFRQIIIGWLNRNYGKNNLQSLLNSLTEGRFRDFETLLGQLVVEVLSYYDTEKRYAERVYHAFVLGLVVHLNHRYQISSNREAGLGRYDLMMRPRHSDDRGIIMEFKAAQTPDAMEAALDTAEEQMRLRSYASDLEHSGVRLRSEIAVAFCGKEVRVRGQEIR